MSCPRLELENRKVKIVALKPAASGNRGRHLILPPYDDFAICLKYFFH